MKRIFLSLSGIAVVLALLTGTAVYWASHHDVVRARRDAAIAVTRSVALTMAARIDQLNRSLIKMAKDPEVIAVFTGDDPVAREAMAVKLEKYLPEVLKIRLLRPDVSQLDDQHIPRMGYADLEMVRQTPDKNQLPAVQGEGPDRHLAMTARVVADQRVIGVILASLSYDFIKGGLQSVALTGQHIQLKQGGLELAASGTSDSSTMTEEAKQHIPDTSWDVQTRYTPSTGASEVGLVSGIVATAGLLLALVFFVGYRVTSDLLRRDQSSILKAFKDLMTGNASGNYPVYFNEMSVLISSLVQFKRVLSHQGDEFQTPSASSEDSEFSGFFEESDFAVEELAHDADSDHDVARDAETSVRGSPIKLPEVEPDVPEKKAGGRVRNEAGSNKVPAEIFRAYDIRGIVGKTLTAEIAYDIGRAFGTEAKAHECQTVVLARDGRNSSPMLAEALADGLIATGRDVLDLGMVPTPVLYFVAHHTPGRTGMMVTGSHNPAEYNGLKLVINGETLAGAKIQRLRECIESRRFVVEEKGSIDQNSMFVNEYIGMIAEDVHLVRPMKVVLDCGNGVAGEIGPVLLRTLGCEVIELFCEVDGGFPNHHPDPSKPDNLSDLITTVKQTQADLGIAFDGDGDRLGIVDSSGAIIWPDRQMMLFAKDVLSRKPGVEIIYDVKCSKHLPEQITKYGGRPLMWKTGHSLMKAKLKETGAKLAGEMSGHIFFNDRWFGFDDALYSAARMIEILSSDTRSSADVFAGFPDSPNTPELNVPMREGESAAFIEKLAAKADFKEGKITDIDGLRVDFADGWGLVRASNTTPSLVVRFEADNEQALHRIQGLFKKLMTAIKPDITLPF